MNQRIYTRTGDKGITHLVGGRTVGKETPRVEAYGDVDELNCILGLARCDCQDTDIDSILGSIQNLLFQVGTDLATPAEVTAPPLLRISPVESSKLEETIDRLQEELPVLKNFILPGGTLLAARLHHARAICRRAERHCVLLNQTESINAEVVSLLNRLSDLLFIMARTANHRAGTPDQLWAR